MGQTASQPHGTKSTQITKCQKSKEAQLARYRVGSAGRNIWGKPGKTSRYALRGSPCRPGASSSQGEGHLSLWSEDSRTLT
jgi:hypothetical protein